jgi:hypothetical protein
MRIFLSLLWSCLFAGSVFAQQKTSPFTKFGKISLQDLQKKIYPLDSNANAVVLSDIGEASVVGNSKGWFSIEFTRHCVVHILNKNGYDEAGVEISLYTNGDDEEKLDNVKGVTYNLENGKIVETKLDKSSVFKEKVDKKRVLRKFTMPNVKEGSIIEYEYKVISDYISNLDPWVFQGSSPVLWSEFNLSVPQFFTYAFLSRGYHPLYLNDPPKNRQENFTVVDSKTATSSGRVSFTSGVTDYRWVMKDIPELKEESFTSTIKNHLSRIEFQLSSQSYPLEPRDFRSTWSGLTHELNESQYFGGVLKNNNNWLSDDVKPVVQSASSDKEKAQKIFEYVRDHFSCTSYNGLFIESTLKNVLKNKKGSVSEINLLMTAMLRYAGLNADPVILSTTHHGYSLEMYPMLSSFNYVVAQCMVGDKKIYLDASHTGLGFGKMLPDCYNGHARVVDEQATAIAFSADSLRERKVTALFISNNEKGEWVGSMNQTEGYFESYMIREKVKEKGTEEFFKTVQKDFGSDIKIVEPHIDSLKLLEEPVVLKYNVDFSKPKEDILYVNPLFGEGYKKNPFKSDERFYPVEMPYTQDETYILTMEVPAGYEVDELPKQIVAKMDEQGSAVFEYRLSLSGSTISLRSRISIKRTLFMPDEYEILREFFNLIVSKQNEQIVFKKKK